MTSVTHLQTTSAAALDTGIAWAHTEGDADALSAYAFGKIASGGPCAQCSENTADTTVFDTALASVPVVASYAEYADGLVYFYFGFAAPPGVYVCAHISIVRSGA